MKMDYIYIQISGDDWCMIVFNLFQRILDTTYEMFNVPTRMSVYTSNGKAMILQFQGNE